MTRARLVSSGVARLAGASRTLATVPTTSSPALRQLAELARSRPATSAAARLAQPWQGTRFFSASAVRAHGHIHKPKPGEEYVFFFFFFFNLLVLCSYPLSQYESDPCLHTKIIC